MVLERKDVSEFPRLQVWKKRGNFCKVRSDKESEGVELFYLCTPNFFTSPTDGNRQKPRLLVLHGYPTSSYDFAGIWDQLTEEFEVFAWDYAGYGFSQKVHRTIPQQVDLLESLLEELGLWKDHSAGTTKPSSPRLHIFSHDLGDTLMQEMLARQVLDAPDSRRRSLSIESVVALNGGLFPAIHRPTFMQRIMLVPFLASFVANFISPEVFRTSVSKVFGPNTKPSDLDISEWFALGTSNGGDALFAKNIQYITERDENQERWEGALCRYIEGGSPFRLIDGPADPVSGRHLADHVQATLVPLAKDPKLAKHMVVYLDDEIGHWPQMEAPKETMEALLTCHKEVLATLGS